MGDFPVVDGGRYLDYGSVRSGATRGTVITPSTTAHTKGTVVELVAATDFDADSILVQLTSQNAGTVDADYLVDILIDSSVERVLIPNLIFSSIEAFQHASARYMFPIAIPKGSRLSAQCQAGAASAQGLYVNVILGQSGFAGKMPFGSKVTAYGANIGTTRGINIDPGGTANTPVTVEIDPSIDDEINGLVLGIGGAADFVKTTHTRWAVDIMGGAATEQILIPGILLLFGSAMDLVQPTASIFFPIRIAKGTRLAIRAQSTSITAVDRTFDAVIYGVH